MAADVLLNLVRTVSDNMDSFIRESRKHALFNKKDESKLRLETSMVRRTKLLVQMLADKDERAVDCFLEILLGIGLREHVVAAHPEWIKDGRHCLHEDMCEKLAGKVNLVIADCAKHGLLSRHTEHSLRTMGHKREKVWALKREVERRGANAVVCFARILSEFGEYGLLEEIMEIPEDNGEICCGH